MYCECIHKFYFWWHFDTPREICHLPFHSVDSSLKIVVNIWWHKFVFNILWALVLLHPAHLTKSKCISLPLAWCEYNIELKYFDRLQHSNVMTSLGKWYNQNSTQERILQDLINLHFFTIMIIFLLPRPRELHVSPCQMMCCIIIHPFDYKFILQELDVEEINPLNTFQYS